MKINPDRKLIAPEVFCDQFLFSISFQFMAISQKYSA